MLLSKKNIKIRMTKPELDKYYGEVKKSAHIFKNKKGYDRKRRSRDKPQDE